MFIIRDFGYKNATVHISGGSDRETLEEAATRFFKKVYTETKEQTYLIREIYIAYYEKQIAQMVEH